MNKPIKGIPDFLRNPQGLGMGTKPVPVPSKKKTVTKKDRLSQCRNKLWQQANCSCVDVKWSCRYSGSRILIWRKVTRGQWKGKVQYRYKPNGRVYRIGTETFLNAIIQHL